MPAMRRELERLLEAGIVAPPPDFAERVVAAIAALPAPALRAGRAGLRELAEWLALFGAILAGIPQIAMFVFGIFTVSGTG
jgi:hypothetical protein